MRYDEIRIAIATECGWEHSIEHSHGEALDVWRNAQYPFRSSLPDYPLDLNAMNEAEKSVNLEFYVAQLLAVIHQVDKDYFNKVSWENACELTTATAIQRAEAFLRTIGKWKD